MSGSPLRRRPWPSLRTEILVVPPVALLLLVAISTFTLFSYRSALLRLAEERQEEAMRLARGIADQLLAGAAAGAAGAAQLPAPERLRQMAPGASGAGLLAADGMVLAAAGELPPLALTSLTSPTPPASPASPTAGRELLPPHPFAVGPDTELPDTVAGFVPLVLPGAAAGGAGRPLLARADLPAATLGAQLQAVRRLSWAVLPINSALVLVVLLFLRHLLTPYDTLLARARQLGHLGPAADAAADEGELLIATLERAMEALGERQREPHSTGEDDDLAALERTLAPSLESGLLLLGRDGRVLSLNLPGAALLGTAPAPGLGLAELLAPHPEMRALIEAAIAHGQPVRRQELVLHRAGAAPAALGMSVHPLRRGDGPVRAFLVLFADLTEAQRRAEESRLAERLATLGEMAAGAAHELRNSLATLRGYLTLIERHQDEESIADLLPEIRHEADHLQRVLEDFLAFARPGTARFEPVSLPALVRRAAADPALAGVAVEVREAGEAAAGGERAGKTAGTESAATGGAAGAGVGDAPTLRGDPLLIERALRNVLHNAAQAEREAGRAGPVEVAVGELPAAVEVTVADRGPGVPAEVRGRLFHPFATGRAGGVGLGLALAHRIVTLHGGHIRLEDRAGGGTLARLTFARGDSATEGSTPKPATPPGGTPAAEVNS